jgi:hypothetical protein
MFEPIVSDSMANVGTTRQYQELDQKVRTIAFADAFSFDLDNYVTDAPWTALLYAGAGGAENPAARVTDLFKDVFGSR